MYTESINLFYHFYMDILFAIIGVKISPLSAGMILCEL